VERHRAAELAGRARQGQINSSGIHPGAPVVAVGQVAKLAFVVVQKELDGVQVQIFIRLGERGQSMDVNGLERERLFDK
jgi:hypothetical protein